MKFKMRVFWRFLLETKGLLLTVIILAIGCYVYGHKASEKNDIPTFVFNLAPSILVLLVPVFFAELIRFNQTQKKRKVGLERMRKNINRHLTILFSLYKASALKKRDKEFEKIKDFFDEAYFEGVKSMDFSAQAPVNVEMDWFNFFKSNLYEFKVALRTTLDTYHSYFEWELLEAIENATESHYMSIIMEYDRLYFQIDSDSQFFREYVSSIMKIVEIYNNEVSEDKKVLAKNIIVWGEHVVPKLGSARI